MATNNPTLPKTMHAHLFTSTINGMEKNLSLSTNAALPVPTTASLTKDQVLVKVLTMALNPVDYKFAEIPIVGGLMVKRPSSPGLDFAGRVVSVGGSPEASTTDLKPGQLVFGRLAMPTRFGTLAEYVVAPTQGTVPIPEGVSVQDAACVGTAGLTAYTCIAPHIKKGDRIFLNGGSGGVGTFGIQIAKTLGCDVVTSCSSANLQMCKDLGADEVLDYKKVDVVEGLIGLAKEKGRMFDLVVDNVGNPTGLYWKAQEFMKPEGKFVQVGSELAVGPTIELLKRMFWPGFLGGGQRPFAFADVPNKNEYFTQIGEWLQQGKVKAVKDQVFAYEDAVKAYEKMRSGRARGKILIEVARE